MSTIIPKMLTGVNIAPTQTSATGANWVAFPSQNCLQLTISNNSGVVIEFDTLYAGTFPTNPVPVYSGTYYVIYGITNANQVKIRRTDQSNTQVTVNARAEGA